jgi:tetratricopeptide (TPR) repeat protein
MRFHLDRDQVNRAQAVLSERFAAAAENPERLFLEAKVLSGNGDDEGAVAQYDAALKAADGAMAEAWLNRGVALRRLGRIEDALASYRSALEQRPGYPEAWYNIGVGRSEQGDHAQAAAAYERCLQLDPGRSRAWYNLGMQRVRMGDEAGALPAFEAAIAAQPQYASAWYNLAVFQRKLGHPSAGASLDSVVTRFPENEKGWFNRGVYRADLGDLDEAIRSYQKAIEVEPGYVAAWNNLAGCLHDAGDEEGALAAFREAVQLAPEVPGYRFNLGLQCERMRAWDEAIVHYRRAHQLDADFSRPIERIVELDGQGRAGDWGLWARDCQLTQDSLVVLGPDSVYELGRSLHRLGFTSEARVRYADAVVLGKEGVWPAYWSSKAAEESGLTTEAISGYQLVLSQREDFKFALYRLALLLADQDVEEARSYWDRLVLYHPEFAEEKSAEKP